MMGIVDQLSEGSQVGSSDVSLRRFADEVGKILDDYVKLFIDISNKSVQAQGCRPGAWEAVRQLFFLPVSSRPVCEVMSWYLTRVHLTAAS